MPNETPKKMPRTETHTHVHSHTCTFIEKIFNILQQTVPRRKCQSSMLQIVSILKQGVMHIQRTLHKGQDLLDFILQINW